MYNDITASYDSRPYTGVATRTKRPTTQPVQSTDPLLTAVKYWDRVYNQLEQPEALFSKHHKRWLADREDSETLRAAWAAEQQ